MTLPLFDAHCDTISRLWRQGSACLAGGDGQWDLDRLDWAAPRAQIFALFCDSAEPGAPQAADAQYQTFLCACGREASRVAFCRTGAEADAAFRDGKLAAFLSVEGAELLGCGIDGLRRAWRWGVRVVHPTWNHANLLSGSHCDEPRRGLSREGRAFVSEMRRLHMLTDVSHLSEAGFWDVVECTEGPILASHSNSQSVYFHSRNLTDAQFTAIIKNHGVVGLNCYSAFLGEGDVTMEDLLRHLEHFLALGGEKTVALGGDWDGCDRLPRGMQGCWNWLDFAQLLRRRNYPEDLIADLYFNNLMRTVREVCTI